MVWNTPALAQSGSVSPPVQIHGEVLMLTSEFIIVESAEGTSILIPFGKDTAVDPSLKVGDHVEVIAATNSHVTSVKKLFLAACNCVMNVARLTCLSKAAACPI